VRNEQAAVVVVVVQLHIAVSKSLTYAVDRTLLD
jgi:hypothetical protein